jgi:hypothetical protein
MRHKSLNRLLGGAAAVGLMTAVAAQGDPASAQQRPNIVMLMTDDTGWNDFGAYSGGGALGHPTPNVDQIAKEGAVFTNWYGQAKQNVSQFQQSHPDAKQNASQVEQNRTAQENQLQSNRTDEANQLQANRTNEANQLQANRYNEVGQLQNNRVNNWNNYNGDWGGYYSVSARAWRSALRSRHSRRRQLRSRLREIRTTTPTASITRRRAGSMRWCRRRKGRSYRPRRPPAPRSMSGRRPSPIAAAHSTRVSRMATKSARRG